KAVANNASPDPVPLLMTRPRGAAERFVASLPPDVRDRVRPIYSPLIAIEGLDADVDFKDEAAVFSSANGVAHGPLGAGRRAYCVGAATTRAALARGWAAEERGQTAEALIAGLIAHPPAQPLIHLSGVHTRGDIAARLTAQGIQTRNVAIYDQVAQPLTAEARAAVARGNPLMLPLFSPRTAAQFANQVPKAATVHVIALSDAVADPLVGASYGRVTVAARPDANAMSDEIARVLNDMPSG
ncbi:unnamed protein product, partial [Chrysoparadoxa australica]